MDISREELEQIISDAAKKALVEYAKEQQKKDKKGKYHDTYALMKCYRDAAFHVDHAVSEVSQVAVVAAGDFIDEKEELYLRSIRRTKFRTMVIKTHIDKALDEVERRRKEQGRECEYKAFVMYFMEGLDYQKISEELNTGPNTPRRWIKGIINELSILLWGIELDKE